jgi:hypothetical protein
MKQLKIVGTDALVAAADRLYQQGEISEREYEEIVRRNNLLSRETRCTTVYVG